MQVMIMAPLICRFREVGVIWVWQMTEAASKRRGRRYLQNKQRKCGVFFPLRMEWRDSGVPVRKPLLRWKRLINWSYLWSGSAPSEAASYNAAKERSEPRVRLRWEFRSTTSGPFSAGSFSQFCVFSGRHQWMTMNKCDAVCLRKYMLKKKKHACSLRT